MNTHTPPGEDHTEAARPPDDGEAASAYDRRLAEFEEQIESYRRQVAEYEARKAQKLSGLAHTPRRLRRASEVQQQQELPEHSKLAPRIYAFFRLLVLVPLAATLAFLMLGLALSAWQGERHAALVLYCFYPPGLALYLMWVEVQLTWKDLRHPAVNAPDSFTSLFRLPRDLVEISVYSVLTAFCTGTLTGENAVSIVILFAFSTLLLLFQGCLVSWTIPGAQGAQARREARKSLRICLIVGTVVLGMLFPEALSAADSAPLPLPEVPQLPH